MLASPELMDNLEWWAHQERPAALVHLVIQVDLDLLVHWDLLVRQALPDNLVLLDLRVTRVRLEMQVLQDQPEDQDQLDLQELTGSKDSLERLAAKAQQVVSVLQDQLEQSVFQGRPAESDSRVRTVLPDLLGPLDLRVQDHKETQAIQDQPVSRALLDQLDHRVVQEVRDFQDLLVRRVPLETLVPQDRQETRDQLDPQDP